MSQKHTENPEDYIISRKKLDNTFKYGWFTKGYAEYEPDADQLKLLRKYRKHLRFVVFGGSWCEDTHKLLPKFFKTVEMAGIARKNTELFGVDRDKKPVGNTKDKTGPDKDYHIKWVPTFIIFYEDDEIGRIVESVKKNIESDLVKILQDAVDPKTEK